MIFSLAGALQVILAIRVMARLLKTAGGDKIQTSTAPSTERISIILPVVNEAARIEACLECLTSQPKEVAEILVVDGGSTDGTQAIAKEFSSRDHRIRLLDASPVDRHWTGKAWGLHVGLRNTNASVPWVLCIDADVCCAPETARSLLAHARRSGISTFSIATTQRLAGPIDALLHPALLTTLVYRFGIPGKATRNLHEVQANGQCFMSRRETLLKTEAFRAAQTSLCEDITIVRRLAECGERIGFYESAGLVEVSMYADWRETWRNWPRSLPMRDQYFGWREAAGLAEVLAIQALPLPLFLFGYGFDVPGWWGIVNAVLVLTRLGVLAGVARAYKQKPWTYWLSPLLDVPVAIRLIASALARRHLWRGRTYVRLRGGRFKPLNDSETVGHELDVNGTWSGRSDRSLKSIPELAIRWSMALIARALAAGRLESVSSGLEHIPRHGPALLVVRHYHHLFDGVALFQTIPRQVHILVTLDWAPNAMIRRLMESATSLARWPVILRRDALTGGRGGSPHQKKSVFSLVDVERYRRKAMRESLQLLLEGRVLAVFPEGYPNIDPHYTPKKTVDEMLPFKAGFAAIIAAAEKRLGAKIPIIPTGLCYTHSRRWKAYLNFGEPVSAADFSSRRHLVSFLEKEISQLSRPPDSESAQATA